MKKIVKIISIILLIANSFLLVLSLLYLIYGSIEFFPTEEQQEKIRFVMGMFTFIFLVIELVLIFIFKKSSTKANKVETI